MSRRKENGIVLQEKRDVIHLILKLSFRKRILGVVAILLVLALLALGSSLGDDARSILIDFLVGAVQTALISETHPKP